jgi:opacity protein-like surface antigen
LNFGFGAEYEVADNTRVSAKYQISKMDFEIDVNIVRLGLSYTF